MLKDLNKLEIRILTLAAFCLGLFSFLLYDDSLLDFESNTTGLQKIGVVSSKSNDVRQKFSKQYLWRESKQNAAIHQGDSIFTGRGSESQITLLDGSKMTISENSLVVFSVEDGQLGLDFNFGGLTGGITGKTKLRLTDCGQVYELAGEGSEFQVEKQGGCSGLKVKVTSGEVSINGSKVKNKQIAVVKNGAQTQLVDEAKAKPELKSKPEAPVVISPKPYDEQVRSYSDTNTLLDTTLPLFQWTYSRSKTYFEYQVATDTQFAHLISKNYIQNLSVKSPELKTGKYFFRVREYPTKKSTVTLWSAVVPFSVLEKHAPLKLQAPLLLTKSIQYRAPAENPPQFEWKGVTAAKRYLLELSNTEDFANPIKTEVQGQRFPWSRYRGGQYYFRVSAISNQNQVGFPSEVGKIRVELNTPILEAVPPKVVRGATPEATETPETFNVKWKGLPIADSYQIEVSEDDKFESPLVFKSRNPASEITVPKAGAYKWRVRPLASSGKPLTAYSQNGDLNYQFKVPLGTPKLSEPAENMTLFFQKDSPPLFWMEWQKVRQAESYELEVSSKKDFSVADFRIETKSPRVLIKNRLPQGKLYWRVRASGEGKISEWSVPRRMRIYSGKSAMIHKQDQESEESP